MSPFSFKFHRSTSVLAAGICATVALTMCGFIYLSGWGAIVRRAMIPGKAPDVRPNVWNERDARARYVSTGELINEKEAILIAMEYLARTGKLAKNDLFDWDANFHDRAWLVLASRRPATPGDHVLVTISQEGTVLGSADGE
jgi:hypothetical protein